VDQHPSSKRRLIVWILRLLVIVLVCLGVSGTVRSALDQLSQHDWHVRPAWLIVSGSLYVIGLAPMAWFWYCALASLGQPAPLLAVVRAYFLGHLGKYVPGKAMAVVLRVAGVGRWVKSIRTSVVSSLLETLIMMSVGAFLAASLSTVVLRLDPSLAAIAAVIAIAAGLPTLPPLARRLARIGMARLKPENAAGDSPSVAADGDATLRHINFRLLAKGWIAACVCWLFLGVSLWSTLRAIGVEDIELARHLPLLVAAVAMAVVAGFASMLPGGLVVRDALLMQLLAPHCGTANALVAAVLVRLVWLVSELAACVILYVGERFRLYRSGIRKNSDP
jgi:uncharacterized membrane protein YbhN (UPF0104 family)